MGKYGELTSQTVQLDTILPGQPYMGPDGPEIEVPYIGRTGTFLTARPDLVDSNSRAIPTLMHHVPMSMRGPYKLDRFPGELGEREGAAGYAMCTSEVNPNNRRVLRNSGIEEGQTRLCKAKAINRSGKCSRHGGMLHPLDRKKVDWEQAPREIRFKYGKLPVEELDDEELSRGQIRKADGSFTDNKHVSIEIHDAMVRRLFERADTKLRENLLTAVDTMAELAASPVVEPADRIKAATWIYERLRGKVPTEVKITQDKPFEVVLGAVLEGGSRAASRARRGVASEEELAALDNTLDVEIVEEVIDETVDYYDGEDPETAEAEQLSRYTPPDPPAILTPFGPNTVPPEDPDLRQVFEKKVEEHEKTIAEQRKEFEERMKQARAQRYAARAQGHDTIEDQYYEVFEVEDSPEDGPRATKVFWKEPPEPKTSRAAEAQEKKRRRKEEYDR